MKMLSPMDDNEEARYLASYLIEKYYDLGFNYEELVKTLNEYFNSRC